MVQPRDAGKCKWQATIICAILLLLTLAVYWPSLGNDFVNYDDPVYVTSNEHVESGINRNSMVWAFTTGHGSNWHPLTWISHELDCQIFGTKPKGAHFTNLLFHLANTLLVFGVLQTMTGAVWRSAFVAALFGLHPAHVESVAWISERKDVLSAFFWLLTMLAYIRSTRAQGPRPKIYYGLALFCFALGLMSKPMLVTLPFVLLLIDFWPLRRIDDLRFTIDESKEAGRAKTAQISLVRAIVEKVPFFVLAAGSSVVTFVVQRKGGAVASLGAMPPGARIANAVVSYLRYVGKLFWPENLSVLYPMPPAWPGWLVMVATIFVAGISALAMWQAKQRPYLFTGWFWFTGTLVPVIGLVQVGVQSMADRYLYVPAIGLFIAVAWGAGDLAAAWPRRRELAGTAAGIILAGCCLMTRAQIRYWQNGETLFQRAITVTSNNYLAYNNLGYYLENHGKADDAVGYYRKSVEINPGYEEARNNLGHILTLEGKYEEAIIHLQEALKIKPDLVEARNNLGNVLGDLGRQNEAIEQYEQALRYKSDDADAHNNLGVARAMQGKVAEAEQLLREAVRLKPSDGGAHGNLGNVLAMEHKPDEAIKEYEMALRLNPGDSQAHYNLGNMLLEKGRLAEAADQFREAIKRKLNNPDAYYRLGMILAAEGRKDEAAANFREVLRINPRYEGAQSRLDALLNGK